MTLRTLISRSLRFHWRGHLGVLLGAAVGSAALIGALVVGDSVRLSLRELALQRLGNVTFAMETGDRHFRSELDTLVERAMGQSASSLRDVQWSIARFMGKGTGTIDVPVTVSNRFVTLTTTSSIPASQALSLAGFSTNHSVHASAALKLDATATMQGGQSRANKVQLLGVGTGFGLLGGSDVFSNLPPDAVVLNDSLAAQLRVATGDVVTVRTRKPDALGGDSPLAPQDETAVVLRLRVHKILTGAEGGNFNLTAGPTPPHNAFVSLPMLQEKTGVTNRANLLLADAPLLTSWRKPEFTWMQWLGNRLGRFGAKLIPPASMTNQMPHEESLTLLQRALVRRLSLSDLQLQILPVSSRNEVELRSSRVLLDQPIVEAVFSVATNAVYSVLLRDIKPYGVLTYLVNLIRHGEQTTPYSMVTAAESPLVPADMADDEIIINQWLAEDLDAKVGSEISLTWFVPDQAAQLVEATNRFRVRDILPMTHPALDRSLMPDFPGVAGAEKAGDWETGFPLVHEIRPRDDKYWSDYRGTPKAFVSLKAGQRMWASHLGSLTAIRFPAPRSYNEQPWHLHQSEVVYAVKRIVVPQSDTTLLAADATNSVPQLFDQASLGFQFQDVRAQALAGASQSQDFGGLFIGFSFFLILAALILMALLFQFGIEQRTNEVGVLLALGFTPARVRNLLLGEGVAIAFLGGLIGMAGGVGYAQAMLYGLATLWRDAVGTSALRFHATSATLVIGLFASVVVSAVTIWIVLRKQARRPARELLSEGAELNVERSTLNVQRSTFSRWIALGSGVSAIGMIGWAMFGGDGASAGLFFGAGGLLLIGLLAGVAMLLSALERSEASRQPTVAAMGLRNGTRRRSRSLASVALLACGSFLVAAIGANRLDAGRDATKRSAGTGGFALFGEATLPVVRDLNTPTGREFYSLDEKAMQGVSVVPFRVRDGDDASCLNLNRAQTPRLLGVKPELLAERKAFTFAKVLKGLPAENPWELLSTGRSRREEAQTNAERGMRNAERKDQSLVTSTPTTNEDDAIPAIGDAASIQWALGKKLGDTIEFTDERGQKFKVRLVAGVANSILQGNLIIDEAEFVKRFPGEAGHRMFLVDVPSNTGAETNRLEKTSAAMSRALQDVGLELTPTTTRLEAFNAVQNTYLNTFQILGGLGLLLGSAGLGVVVLRNVLERRSELGLLQAVGFRRRSLQWLVLSEHGGLLALGLAVGITAAVAAVLPALLAPGAENHYVALIATLAGVFVSGLAWTWVATRLALRGELLKALRNE